MVPALRKVSEGRGTHQVDSVNEFKGQATRPPPCPTWDRTRGTESFPHIFFKLPVMTQSSAPFPHDVVFLQEHSPRRPAEMWGRLPGSRKM
jgi:hypothetical protein